VLVPANLRSLTVAALFLSGCQKHTSTTIFVDPALAPLVPAETVFIAGVRVQQLPHRPKLTVVDKFAHDSGIDVGENLWEVLMPFDGKNVWVMLRGKFSEMGMEPRINKEGAKRLNYKGYPILGDDQMAVLFLNPTTAVAATPVALQRIVDNRETGAGIPQALQAQIQNIPPSNQAWFAGELPEIGPIAGGIDFRSGLNPRLTATGEQKFVEMLHRLFDGVQVQQSGTKIRVTLDVPYQRLDDLIGLFSL
jgi:hypothetical protein